jgi:hypothetical protein
MDNRSRSPEVDTPEETECSVVRTHEGLKARVNPNHPLEEDVW